MSTGLLTPPGGALAPQNLPPYSDTIAPRVIATLTSFLALAIITYGLRIWSRLQVYRFVGLDDYAISIALGRTSKP
jgi:hypothetical protein